MADRAVERVAGAAPPNLTRNLGLLRVLGVVFGLAVGVGSMVGAGILRTPGSIAHLTPTTWFIMALWVAAGAHSLLGANVAAELFTELKEAGGVYVPVRRAFGDVAGSLIGWADIINQGASTAAMALAGVDFLALAWPAAHGRTLQLAVAIIIGLFAINVLGVREGRAAQVMMTAAKFVILLAIVAGALLLPPTGATASQPFIAGFSIASAVAAYQLVLGVYSGWINPAYFVEEDVAPNRNVPRVLFGSVAAVAVLYVLMNWVLLRIIPLAALGTMEIPVGYVIGQLAGAGGTLLLGLTGFLLIVGCCNAGLMVAPRIVFGLARDGLFPRWGTQVSRSGTPQLGLAFITLLSIALVATGSFDAAFRLVAATGVVTYVALDVALFALRRREPQLERPFRAIGYPLLPAATVVLDTLVLAAIVWFDPVSGAITIGSLAAVGMIWTLMKVIRKR